MNAHRCGTVGLVGRPSTGKSTLLNRMIGERLAIVSPKPQTTRHLMQGVLTTPDAQFVFVDSPGLPVRSRSLLQRVLARRADEAMREPDVVAFVVEAGRLSDADHGALARIPETKKQVAVVNKVDRVGQERLLPYLQRIAALREFDAIVPVSARTGRNVPRLLEVLRALLPEGEALYPPDQLTDRDERFLAAERVREKLFLALGEDLPYRCEVLIESFRKLRGLRRIDATILVERASQKPIVVGRDGAMLKRIGEGARRDLEGLLGGRIHLALWVKVREGWSSDARVLRQLGHG